MHPNQASIEMDRRPIVEVPKVLKHWINSVQTPSCALLGDFGDLLDGRCYCELVESIFQRQVNVTEEYCKTSAGRIQFALNTVGDAIGWMNIPPEFKSLNCARILSTGEPILTIRFLEFLHELSKPTPVQFDFETNEEDKRSHDIDQDTLTFGKGELNSAAALTAATAPTEVNQSELNSEEDDSLDNKNTTYKRTVDKRIPVTVGRSAVQRAHNTTVHGTTTSNKTSSSTTTASKTAQKKISSAAHPVRKTSVPSRSASSVKSLTTPAHITVRSGQGLAVGSGLVDPTYKAGRKGGFVETISAPVVEELQSSDDSDSGDSIRPTYDYIFSGQPTSSKARTLKDKALVNVRLPHSRSTSPVGRRHVHCQLRSVPSVVEMEIGASLSEIGRKGAHPLHRASERNQKNSVSHPHTYPQQQQREQQDDVRAVQSRAVLNVFQKQSEELRRSFEQQKTGKGHMKKEVDIDSVISTEKKNIILMWVQRTLGVTLDVFLNSSTSHHYNISVGKHLSLSDGITVTKSVSTEDENHSNRASHLIKHKKRHSSVGNESASDSRGVDKENYPFYPVQEDVHYIPGRTPQHPGSYSIASYIGKITAQMPQYTNNAATQAMIEQLLLQEQHGEVLQIPVDAHCTTPFSPHQGHKTPVTPVGFLNDPWVNGVLLSQIVAALFVENRALIKKVDTWDRFGRATQAPRLILTGTECVVKSRAQAMHNLQVCMDVMSANIPGFPALDYCSEDILTGAVSLWKLLETLHESVRQFMRSRSATRGRSRTRSTSPSGHSNGSKRSQSLSIPRRQTSSSSSSSLEHNQNQRVSFAESFHPEPRSRGGPPSPSSPPRRPGIVNSTSRSHSPRSAQQHKKLQQMQKEQDNSAGVVTLLELRRQEKEHERERARLYAQKKRQQASDMSQSTDTNPNHHSNNVDNTGTGSDKQRVGWNSTTTVDRPRSSSVTRRSSINSCTTASAGRNGKAGVVTGAVGAASVAHTTQSGEGQTNSNSSDKSNCWVPPHLSNTEIEAARNTPLPSVSVHQQRAIRDWIKKTFGIQLLDAECGFYFTTGLIDGEEKPPEAPTPHGMHSKYEIKFDPNYDVTTQHAPPPLPLQEDRVRNGVLLGQLLIRLEPHAAQHAHIPKLLHKKPRSMSVCLENIERVLWVFKLRRCPPIPLQYLCQPEEILKGSVSLLWGLLWEIMQAYPYATVHIEAAVDISKEKKSLINSGVMSAEATHTAPTEGSHNNFHVPIRNGLAKVFSQAAEAATARRSSAAARRASSAGLKGEEAKHRIPNNMRYNYADPQLENPVAAHTLPYSDRQRHHLDISLLQWLEENGILGDIIGSLSKPITILALESYCRDGTLFCMLTENVLKLTLSKDWNRRPTTYIECMSNLKHCLDVLRKCKSMRPRYLYAGVEEDICRGQWDCILGLLEDMHRFADKVHPHAQIFSTVDPHGRVVRDIGAKEAINYDTIEAPYLSSNPNYILSLDEQGDDEVQQNNGDPLTPPKLLHKTGLGETEWSPVRVSVSSNNRSDLLHDIPYSFAPRLDIAPKIPESSSVPQPTAPRLEQQQQQHQQLSDITMDSLHFNPQAVGRVDLYPSNPVSGKNVVDFLGQVGEGVTKETQQQHERSTIRNHGHGERHIPTPVKHRPAHQGGSQLSDSPDSLTAPTPAPMQNSKKPHQLHTSTAVQNRTSSSDSALLRQHRLSQALGLTDSEVDVLDTDSGRPDSEAAKNKKTCSATYTGSPSSPSSTGRPRSRSSSPNRSSNVTSTASPNSSAVKRFHRYNRRGVNTTAVSEFDADSLEDREDGNPRSPNSVQSNAIVENVTNNIDLHKVRKIVKWFKEVGIRVDHKNGNFMRQTFTDGVLLCQLLQRLERCGPIAGTVQHPRTHSERVQNVRRCLELLATRHKKIPLRALSCEEEVLGGDIGRTVELLCWIRKAYATHRL